MLWKTRDYNNILLASYYKIILSILLIIGDKIKYNIQLLIKYNIGQVSGIQILCKFTYIINRVYQLIFLPMRNTSFFFLLSFLCFLKTFMHLNWISIELF